MNNVVVDIQITPIATFDTLMDSKKRNQCTATIAPTIETLMMSLKDILFVFLRKSTKGIKTIPANKVRVKTSCPEPRLI